MTRSARSTYPTGPTTTRTFAMPPWRRIAASLVALSLGAVLTLSLASAAGAQPRVSSSISAQPKVYQASGHGTALAHGVVDLAKLPTIPPHAVTSVQTPPLPTPDALTPAQRQSYNDRMRQVRATATVQPTKAPAKISPSFVGGGTVPLLVKQFDGISSTQAGGGTGNTAIATDLSYVMEGVDNAIAIYRASNGTLAYGPYSPVSFFAPVYHVGDAFAYPQLYYDTMRDRWIVVYLEVSPGGAVTYLDVAVSQSNSPTQPTPGAQFNIYQFGTNFKGTPKVSTYCVNETLGVDYWGLYITCVDYRVFLGQPTFNGNTVLAINKAPLLTGAANPQTYWWNDALQIAGDAGPSLALSPAIEEGVQGGEFIVANDTGYGALSDNLSVCALTNLNNLATITPTLTCKHTSLPNGGHYDPVPARQPGGPNIAVGFGPKQMYYKAGRLFFAWTAGDLGRDIVIWVEVRPELSLSRIDVLQDSAVGAFDSNLNTDAYAPSIVGTDEDDIVVAFTNSNVNVIGSSLPGLRYNGRKAADPLYYMESFLSDATVINGTHATTASWGKYSSCAISLNSVTRGTIWCAGEYPGSVADPGWNTRLYNLRAE